ncbi:hypothetical protein BLA18110_05015 [Burkholderia lata]|nr:hypothetical protein BLA18110_05015 [Burkholderia lata]
MSGNEPMAFHPTSQAAGAYGRGLHVEGSGRRDFYLCIRYVPSWFLNGCCRVETGYTE